MLISIFLISGNNLEVKLEIQPENHDELPEIEAEIESFEQFAGENLDFSDEDEISDGGAENSDPDFSDEKKETQCYYCGQMINMCNIKEHMSKTHGNYHGRMHGNPRSIQCTNCKATFKNESALGE